VFAGRPRPRTSLCPDVVGAVHLVEGLPRNASGKILNRTLREDDGCLPRHIRPGHHRFCAGRSPPSGSPITRR